MYDELFPEPKVPRSLVENEFYPDHYGHYKELDRLNKNIGRYPVGFRHYENFEQY